MQLLMDATVSHHRVKWEQWCHPPLLRCQLARGLSRNRCFFCPWWYRRKLFQHETAPHRLCGLLFSRDGPKALNFDHKGKGSKLLQVTHSALAMNAREYFMGTWTQRHFEPHKPSARKRSILKTLHVTAKQSGRLKRRKEVFENRYRCAYVGAYDSTVKNKNKKKT